MSARFSKTQLAAIAGRESAEVFFNIADRDSNPKDGVIDVRTLAKDLSGGMQAKRTQLEMLSRARDPQQIAFYTALTGTNERDTHAIDLKLRDAERAIAEEIDHVAQVGKGMPLVDEFMRNEMRVPPAGDALASAPTWGARPVESPDAFVLEKFPHLQKLKKLGWDLPALLRDGDGGATVMERLLVYGDCRSSGAARVGVVSIVRNDEEAVRQLRLAAVLNYTAIEVSADHFSLAEKALQGTGIELRSVDIP